MTLRKYLVTYDTSVKIEGTNKSPATDCTQIRADSLVLSERSLERIISHGFIEKLTAKELADRIIKNGRV